MFLGGALYEKVCFGSPVTRFSCRKGIVPKNLLHGIFWWQVGKEVVDPPRRRAWCRGASPEISQYFSGDKETCIFIGEICVARMYTRRQTIVGEYGSERRSRHPEKRRTCLLLDLWRRTFFSYKNSM